MATGEGLDEGVGVADGEGEDEGEGSVRLGRAEAPSGVPPFEQAVATSTATSPIAIRRTACPLTLRA
jgi:hypothetical protein